MLPLQSMSNGSGRFERVGVVGIKHKGASIFPDTPTREREDDRPPNRGMVGEGGLTVEFDPIGEVTSKGGE